MPLIESLLRRRHARTAAAPWLSVHAGESALHGALAVPADRPGARPRVVLMPPAPVPPDGNALRAWRERCRRRVRASVVLRSADFRVLPIEAPPVPREEQREAARWQVADALDFPAEDAAIDVLAMPAASGGARSQLFVVAAAAEPVVAWVQRCKAAELPLAAIDIPEMAMRNLSVLAAGDAPHAFLYVGFRSTRLALFWKRELCSFRQFDLTARQLGDGDEPVRDAAMERLALEIQRTADSFSRQFAGVELEALWLASVLEPAGLVERLALHVSQPVRRFEVTEHVQVDGGEVVDVAFGRDYLLAIGAALRS